ncbi:DNA repair protein RAD50 isoform X1 [Hydra vulgaris]|uniref:DNA repair protein RAD50 isoform X1 n=1 Tax=Hydra vulgaris TaxID=6087 RepID=UPI001F5EFFB0|nr:DNA repair protein RAD50-like [Hydra vulgaris]
MALIEKMQIQGIRSYPPHDSAVIEFQTPLTLIVGKNGTGKTSIIESLKYITTGKLPPDCQAQAFIHDPKLAGEKEVKGQVKLKFRDSNGNRIICSRTTVSTQKEKKIVTKSLDGVIMKISPNGEKESINSRCTDLSKEIVSRLGVPMSVLENVIFCHQEDANWPLSEGKILKQKFDSIFAATKYIQALECIRNLRKDQVQLVKDYNRDLVHLTQKKDKAQEIQSDLCRAQGQLQTTKDQLKKIVSAMQPIECQLEQLNSVSEEVFKREKELGTLEATKEHLKKNALQLRNNISNLFEGELSELEKKRAEFSGTLQVKQKSLIGLQTMISGFETDIKKLNETRANLDKEHGKLQQEAQTHSVLVAERDNFIKKISSKLDLSGFNEDTFTPECADQFLQKLKDLFQSIVSEGKKSRSNYESQLNTLEEEIKNCEKEINGIEGAVNEKQSIINNNLVKIRRIENDLGSLSSAATRLQSLESQSKTVKEELDEYKQSVDSNTINKDIERLKIKKKEADAKLAKLKQEQSMIYQQSKAQNNVESFLKDQVSKRDNIEALLNTHLPKLESLFGFKKVPPKEDLKKELYTYIKKKESEVKNERQKHFEVAQRLAGFESNQKTIINQLKEKELEFQKKEKEVYNVCKDNNYSTYKDSIQQKIEKISNSLVEMGAFEKIYQKYISKLQQENSQEKGCPLCHREFKNTKEVKNLIEELSCKLESVPKKRLQNEKLIEEEKNLHKKLESLIPIKASLDNLIIEIPKLKSNLANLNKEIENEKNKLVELDEKFKIAEGDEKKARSMEIDISKINDYISDLKELDTKIERERINLVGIMPGRTLQSIADAVNDAESEVGNFSKNINFQEQVLLDYQKKTNILETKFNNLHAEKLFLQSKLQERLTLESQLKELKSTNETYNHEIKDSSIKLQPLRSKLSVKSASKSKVTKEKEENEETIRIKLLDIKDNGNKIKEWTEKIDSYIKEGKENAVMVNQTRSKSVELELKRTEENRKKRSEEIAKITDEISKQEIRAREIEDNIKWIKNMNEIDLIEKQILKLKADLSKYGDYKRFVQEKEDLQTQLDKCRLKKAEIEASKKGFESEIGRCERDLASAMYANAEPKYCEKVIEIKTTEFASSDLAKYYKALDSAIMRYHSLKLDEINKIVKEYWVKTYKGNDIDTIEIIAEDEEGNGASKARRSYNYRVVMLKGGVYLDMRSRCSAGQKVLASLIIRLALAETFCLNCGILALDEPTTNLDEANIESLANSLKDIIELRQSQKNFQLLVITHDERFVQELGRSDYVDHYFRVYKENGYSKIHRLLMETRE